MNKVIKGQTLNELTVAVMHEVLSGDVSSSRNGDVHFLNNALLELSNPKSRHVHLEGRKNNIFATIAETFWVMAGADELDPYMSFFLPRAKEFSDNGEDWRGAYGPRIHGNDQVGSVVDIFKKEGLDTRRAVISIYDANLDSQEALRGVYGLSSSKDIPCNNLLHFYVRNNKLNCNAFSRSGDVVWGVTNINIFEWTFLMEHIAQEIGVDVGVYSHFVTNLHIYNFTKGQCEDVVRSEQSLGLNDDKLLFPEGVHRTQEFFEDIIDELSNLIKDVDYPIMNNINNLFSGYAVPTEGNLLFEYVKAVVAFASTKLGKEVEISLTDGDFKDSILASPFRKFGVK